ncbi:HWE histidine kinase domain-containing protein [Bosea sp. (in: a-proteobacteria)]|jgi:light-regulated signal transduction histidine kinase (bacteriophytochrome)|uniref:HWE histidine kinase domain-containing protein n=1 Tax=Bosea sp. (in: a-proteobacteria) TaxID=1871050 RepID=UPI002DDCF50A|nr:HWE histidine kinase domain-containing protein [Bosea sp. (in: a-proteobacteria)]
MGFPEMAVDLTNCDREPIHVPGSIQPHGCLLVCDEGAVVIRRQSENAAAFLGLPEQSLVGRKLEDVLGGTPVHELRNALSRSGQPSRPGLMPSVTLSATPRTFDISVHRFKGNAIIEFELSSPKGPASPLEFARTLVGRLSHVRTPRELIDSAARLLRAILQYDRVMIYQFAADGSGQVVSEARRSDLESFRGQHFPASDIPQQARQLYLLNPIRLVSDASGARHPIEPVLDEAGQPLDLTYSHLRSVSPIHCEYLRNMGVAASMSVSIIVDGALWGLIACHHYSPRSMSMNQRIAAEIFGEFFALQLGALTQKQKLEAGDRARRFLKDLLASSIHMTDLSAFLRSHLATFPQLVACDGVGLLLDGVWSSWGAVPPAEAIPKLAAYVGQASPGAVFATSALSEEVPAARAFAAEASGLLAIPLSQRPRDYLLLFRRELVQTVEWGGDPNKTYTSGPLGDRLTPRQSFAVWKQTVENRSLPWMPVELDLAESARGALIEVVLRQGELLSEERGKTEARQKMLNQELNHRVKNILSVIRSIVSYPVQDETAIRAYVQTIQGRIDALSLAHDQATLSAGGGALRELFAAELAPYLASAQRVTIEGPSAALDPRAFSVLALVIHELATNAAKYGALSREGGRVALEWTRSEAGDCLISWRESGGPPVSPPTRTGFGSALVSRSIPFDLGGRSDVSFAPSGVVARLTIPARFMSWEAASAMAEGAAPAAVPADALSPVQGKSVLLLEDQFLIAMDVEEMLLSMGAASVTICAGVAEAMSLLERDLPDIAVLDVNLGAETSEEVARRLVAAKRPFVFATGYDDGSRLPIIDHPAPVVRKPYSVATLSAALRQALYGVV